MKEKSTSVRSALFISHQDWQWDT